MAQGDPLRAQAIEARLTRRWAERWLAWRGATDAAARKRASKAKADG